ncbi:uncharacterized protein LOC143422550 [Xylocopa sonorina]|uniref:uncharacterized protein LOC143422550 n=1 Tax=Xylocopa sonorina TaxID=1818115 RepID=UPI00403AD99F
MSSLLVMQNLHGLTLFIWLVSLLTLSSSDDLKTDGITPLTSMSNGSSIHGSSKTEHVTSPSVTQLTPEFVNFTKTQNKDDIPSVAGEGGPISIISTTKQTLSTKSTFVTQLPLTVENSSAIVQDNITYAKRGKNTSKIVSRKGATEKLNVKNETVFSTEIMSSNDTKPVVELSPIPSTIFNKEKVNMNLNNSKSNITEKHSTVAIQKNISPNASVTASTVQEHKPKPTATEVEPNSDKEAFIPHIKGSHLGMPKKIDYVLPVIVTLVALPVLGAIIFMVYKQGRDCWDKRHYRRMDFLIDGMYND